MRPSFDNGSDKETDHSLALVNDGVPDVPLFVVMGNHEKRKVFAEKIGPSNFSLDSARLKTTEMVKMNE